MADHSLGIITSASITTGTRFTNLQTIPAERYPAQGYSCQALAANTGVVYICDTATPNLSTGVGVLFVIPIPSSSDSKSLPLLSVDNPCAPNSYNLAEHYVLPAVANEGVRVTANVT